jgi:TetR/AcrR family fatty acid metabolism transcriptional regulator
MRDLSTTYLGLELRNPLVVSASPLSKSVDTVRRLEAAGAAAIVMYSLFEEQMAKVQVELTRAMDGADRAPEKLRRFVRAYMELVADNRHAAEVITIELRQSAKFMKEYKNPRFAEFLKTLAGVVDEGQRQGAIRGDVPAPVAARALFGALDELALMWVTGRGERFDIRKVADWMSDVVLQGLETQQNPQIPQQNPRRST